MNLSFVIPAFNSEKTLSICINSIKQQISCDDEIIVVDNGSTDNSLKIVKDCGIEKIFVKNDCNVSGVRNFGAVKSEGRVLAFIDSDCSIQKDYVKNAKTVMQDETVHVSGFKVDVPENANWIEKAWFSQRKTGEYEANYINAGNFLIKRDVFESIGGFNESLVTDEDAELCLRLRKQGYKILSSDKLAVTHYGNPKTIKAFFRRELWHSTGMLGSFKINMFDKPLLATITFILLHIIGLSMLLTKKYFAGFSMVTFIPAFSSVYRCIQYRNAKHLFSMAILYYVYFIARSLRVLILAVNQIKIVFRLI